MWEQIEARIKEQKVRKRMSSKTNVEMVRELCRKVSDEIERLQKDEASVMSTDAINFMEKKDPETEKSYHYHRTRMDAFACANNVAMRVFANYIAKLGDEK